MEKELGKRRGLAKLWLRKTPEPRASGTDGQWRGSLAFVVKTEGRQQEHSAPDLGWWLGLCQQGAL